MAAQTETMDAGTSNAPVGIREYTSRDATACCWIVNANVAVMSGLNDAARRLIMSKNVPEKLGVELASAYTVVATDGDDVVGVAALDGSELKRFHVAQTHQGRGIGGAMLLALEDEARRRGLARLELLASPASEGFYASYGYLSRGEDRAVSGNAEFVNVRMDKELGGSPS